MPMIGLGINPQLIKILINSIDSVLFPSVSKSRRQFKFVDLGDLSYPDMHRRLFRFGPVGGGESDIFA